MAVCGDIENGFQLSVWNNAGLGNPDPEVLLNQPFETWDLDSTGFFYSLKIMKKNLDDSPKQFEVRGRNGYQSQPGYITGLESCTELIGANTYLGYDLTFPTPAGYTLVTDGTSRYYVQNDQCAYPLISDHPDNQSRNEGDTITLVVAATLYTSVQWYKGGNAVSGATGLTLSIPNCNTSHAGVYYARFTNACGGGDSPSTKDSVSANVTVNASNVSFDVDFAQTMEIEGDCECQEVEWAFSKTIEDIEDVPSEDWQESGVKTFTESGTWHVFTRLVCNNDFNDKRTFSVNSTTRKANLIP